MVCNCFIIFIHISNFGICATACILWVGINDVILVSIFFSFQCFYSLDSGQWSNSNKPSECINYYVSISGWNGKQNRWLGKQVAPATPPNHYHFDLNEIWKTVQCFCRANHKNRTKLFTANWLEFFFSVFSNFPFWIMFIMVELSPRLTSLTKSHL